MKGRTTEVCTQEVRTAQVCGGEIYSREVRFGEDGSLKVRAADVWLYIGVFSPPGVPGLYSLLEYCEVFGICHWSMGEERGVRVKTSASSMRFTFGDEEGAGDVLGGGFFVGVG